MKCRALNSRQTCIVRGEADWTGLESRKVRRCMRGESPQVYQLRDSRTRGLGKSVAVRRSPVVGLAVLTGGERDIANVAVGDQLRRLIRNFAVLRIVSVSSLHHSAS